VGVGLVAGDVSASRAPRSQLAEELRRLRVLAGLSGRGLGEQIGISQSKISRIESGQTAPSLPEVSRWAEAVGADPSTLELVLALTKAALTEIHGWQATLEQRPHLQGDIQAREDAARVTSVFEASLVPGLLQTAGYAQRVFGLAGIPYSPTALAAAVAGRMQRQLALYDTEKEFTFLITEAALRWRPGPTSTQRMQLDRIVAVSTLDNVTVGIVPLHAPARTFVSHSYVIYQAGDAEASSFVEAEMVHAGLIANDPDHVHLYKKHWAALMQMAVFGDAASHLLTSLVQELDGGDE